MISRLGDSQKRVLARVILVVAVGLVFSITALPLWLANAARQDTLDELHERLLRYEQIAARDAELLPQYRALKQAQMSAGNYLKSDTVAVAGAELQRMTKAIAAVNGAQVVSTQILPAANEDGFARIALKVRLRGELPAILRSFYDMETDDVFMFLDSIGLRESNIRRRPGQLKLHLMDAEFELVAYMPEIS